MCSALGIIGFIITGEEQRHMRAIG